MQVEVATSPMLGRRRHSLSRPCGGSPWYLDLRPALLHGAGGVTFLATGGLSFLASGLPFPLLHCGLGLLLHPFVLGRVKVRPRKGAGTCDVVDAAGCNRFLTSGCAARWHDRCVVDMTERGDTKYTCQVLPPSVLAPVCQAPSPCRSSPHRAVRCPICQQGDDEVTIPIQEDVNC